MTNFNPNIRIPTSHRSAVRQLATRNPNFESWRTSPEGGNGAETRKLLREDYLRAIWDMGAWDALIALLATDAPDAPDNNTESGMVDIAETFADIAAEHAATVAPAIDGKAVLDALRPFVGDMVLDVAREALVPLVTAANRIPQTIEVERVVYESLAPGQRAPAKPRAKIVETSTLGKLFGVRGNLASTPMTIWDAPDAPERDPMFTPDPEILAQVVTLWNRGEYPWLAGPAGTGKSTLPRQIAAASKRPFVRIGLTRTTELPDIIGMDKLDGVNGMVWTDGVFTQAIRRPGMVILLDEITICPPGVSARFQTALDDRRLTIETTGEVVNFAPGVVVCAADNTRGYGDETGRFAGTMTANAGLVDRFARMIVVPYLDKAREAQALANRTGAPRPACDAVVAFIDHARNLPGFGDVQLSLRRMKAFVDGVIDGFNVARAFEVAVLTRLPDAEREAIRQAFRVQFDEQDFEASMQGKVVAAHSPKSNAPEQAAARNAFDEVVSN